VNRLFFFGMLAVAIGACAPEHARSVSHVLSAPSLKSTSSKTVNNVVELPLALPPAESRPILSYGSTMGANPFTYTPGFNQQFRGTGPFVRIALISRYSSARGTVLLPCYVMNLQPRQVAYAYLGGWGAGTGSHPGTVDAGLYYEENAALHLDGYRLFIAYHDSDWTPYLRKAPNITKGGQVWQNDANKSKFLPCGRPILLVFRPLSRRLLQATASAVDANGLEILSKVQEPTHDLDGWWPEGDIHADFKARNPEGVLLKAMTTIAVNPPIPADWATNGSYFGRAPKNPIVWSNLQVGRVESGHLTWVNWDTKAGLLIYNQWPDNTRAVIRTASGRYETSIELHGGPPPISK
jgi:hypothetical protein